MARKRSEWVERQRATSRSLDNYLKDSKPTKSEVKKIYEEARKDRIATGYALLAADDERRSKQYDELRSWYEENLTNSGGSATQHISNMARRRQQDAERNREGFEKYYSRIAGLYGGSVAANADKQFKGAMKLYADTGDKAAAYAENFVAPTTDDYTALLLGKQAGIAKNTTPSIEQAQKNLDAADRAIRDAYLANNHSALVEAVGTRKSAEQKYLTTLSQKLSREDANSIARERDDVAKRLDSVNPADTTTRDKLIRELAVYDEHLKRNPDSEMEKIGADLDARLTPEEWQIVMEQPIAEWAQVATTAAERYAAKNQPKGILADMGELFSQMREKAQPSMPYAPVPTNNTGVTDEAYNLLLEKFKDEEKVQEYIKYINWARDKDNAKKQEEYNASRETTLFTDAADSLGSVALAGTSGVTGAADLLTQGVRMIASGEPINWDSDLQRVNKQGQQLRENVSENIKHGRDGSKSGFVRDAASFLYDTGMSYADSMSTALLHNPVLSGVILGSGAAVSAAQDAKDRGVSDQQALLTGIAAGIFEGAFEKLSIGKFFEIGDAKTKKELILRAIMQMPVEGSEELFTEMANFAADLLINKEGSAIMQDAARYEAMGLSKEDAFKKALAGAAVQCGLAFVGGVVFGAVGGITGYVGGKSKVESESKNAPKSPDSTAPTSAPAQVNNAPSKTPNLADSAVIKRHGSNDVGGIASVTFGDGQVNPRMLVSGIEDGDNGDLKVLTYAIDNNGEVNMSKAESAPLDAVTFENETTKELFNFAKANGLNAKEATAYVGGFDTNGEATVQDYNDAFERVRLLAEEGFAADEIKNAIRSDAIDNPVDSAGHVYYEALSVEAVDAAISSGHAISDAAMGKINESSTIDLTELTEDDIKGMDANQQAAVTFGRTLNAVFGINVKLSKAAIDEATGKYTGGSGSYSRETNTITLDLNAGKMSKADRTAFILHTFGHELTHFVEAKSKTQYKVLRDFVVDKLGSDLDRLVQEKQDIYKEQFNEELSREAAIREIVAESCADLIGDSDMVKMMEQKSPDLVASIKDFLSKLISRIEKLVKQTEKNGTPEEARLLEAHRDELLRLWNTAFAEATSEQTAETYNAVEGSAAVQNQARPTHRENKLDEQYMSAVESDDDGNVIPLSARFNEDDPDIRHNLRGRVNFTAQDLITDEIQLPDLNKRQRAQYDNYVARVNELNRVLASITGLRSGLETIAKNSTANNPEARKRLLTYLNMLDDYVVRANQLNRQLDALEKANISNIVKTSVRESVSAAVQAEQARLTNQFNVEYATLVQQHQEQVKALKEKAKQQRSIAAQRLEEARQSKKHLQQTQIIGRIRKYTGKIEEMVTKNTKNSHVPQNVRKVLGELVADIRTLDALDGKGTATKTYQKHIENLRNAIMEAARVEGNGAGNAYAIQYANSEVMGMIESQINEISNLFRGSLREASITELVKLSNMMKSLVKMIRDANELPTMARQKTVDEAASAISQHLNGIRNTKWNQRILEKNEKRMETGGKLKETKSPWRFVTTKILSPVYFFDRLGKSGKDMFKALRDGESEAIKRENTIVSMVHEIASAKQIRKWRNADRIHYGKLHLTATEAMELYMQTKQKDAVQHILNHGVIVRVNAANGQEAVKMTQEDIDGFVKDFKEKHGELAKAADKLAGVVQQLTDWGNETSLQLYNIYQFATENYFPISVYDGEADGGISLAPSMASSPYAMLNQSFQKNRTKNASGALVVGDVFETLSSHAQGMINYSTLAAPMLDCMKIMADERVSTAVKNVYGKSNLDYFSTLMRDMNGMTASDDGGGFASKLFTTAKRARVGFSIRTALLQATSYLRASFVLPIRDLIAGNTIGLLKLRKNWREATQYSGVALRKSKGYFDTGLGGKSISREISDSRGWFARSYDAVTDVSLSLAGLMDEYTWSRLWAACKRKVSREQPKLTGDEYMKAVAEAFDDTIFRTQVTDSQLAKPEMMRSGSTVDKWMTMYASEPLLSYNIMMSANVEYQLARRSETDSSAKKKKAAKKVMLAFGSTAMTTAMGILVQGLSNAIRDDDEYETLAQKILNGTLDAAKGEIGLSDNLPVIRDIRSMILNGFDVERPDMEGVSELVNVIPIAIEMMQVAAGTKEPTKLTYYGRMTEYGAFEQIARALSTLTGIGAYNLIRDFRTIWDTIDNNPDFWGDVYDEGEGAAYDMMYEALVDGDMKEYNRLRGMVKERKDEKGKPIEDKAIAEAIRQRILAGYKENGDEAQASKLLIQYGGMDEYGKGSSSVAYALDNATFDTKDGEDSFTLAGTIVDTMRTGTAKEVAAEIEKVMERYNASASSIKSSITGELKEEYIEGSDKERDAIIQMLDKTGLYDEKNGRGTAAEQKVVDGWVRDYYENKYKDEYIRSNSGRRREIEKILWENGEYESYPKFQDRLKGWLEDANEKD